MPSDLDLILLLMLLIALAFAVYVALHRNAYLSWRRMRAVARVLPCAVTRPPAPFPAECLGKCLDGEGVCTTVETRPWLIFWRQAARCACVQPGAGATGGAGGGPEGPPGPDAPTPGGPGPSPSAPPGPTPPSGPSP